MKVLIDPGHGGEDPGARSVRPISGLPIEEKGLALDLALELAWTLADRGHACHLTRALDVGLTLSDRVGIEHVLRPDAFVSIHLNSYVRPEARGFEIWTSPGETPADRLAEGIMKGFIREFPDVPIRTQAMGEADKEARFVVLTGTRAPAVLLECGFLTNQDDVLWILRPGTARRLARVVAGALCEFR